MKSYFKEIKKDFEKLEEITSIPTFYLEKETELRKSIRYFYNIEDLESSDDFVDIVMVDFIINVYFENNILEINHVISEALRELEFFNIVYVGTEKEDNGYNSCFSFSKNYIRSE